MKRYQLLCVLSLCIVVLVSGCVTTKDNQYQRRVGLYYGEALTLNYTEIMNTNDSYIKNSLEIICYKVNIEYNLSGDDLHPAMDKRITIDNGTDPDNFLRIQIIALTINNNSVGEIMIMYDNPYVGGGKDINEIANYTKSKVKEIATICNITVNVDEIKWTISYDD